jgi:hypothetical protein
MASELTMVVVLEHNTEQTVIPSAPLRCAFTKRSDSLVATRSIGSCSIAISPATTQATNVSALGASDENGSNGKRTATTVSGESQCNAAVHTTQSAYTVASGT